MAHRNGAATACHTALRCVHGFGSTTNQDYYVTAVQHAAVGHAANIPPNQQLHRIGMENSKTFGRAKQQTVCMRPIPPWKQQTDVNSRATPSVLPFTLSFSGPVPLF